jgi:PII-like signaling protein
MGSNRIEGERMRMRITIGESDTYQEKPLHEALVDFFRGEEMLGVTVLRGIGGYGSSSRDLTGNILAESKDTPVVIEVVEYPERIERILQKLDKYMSGGVGPLQLVRLVGESFNPPG